MKSLVIFSGVRWNFTWQRHHSIAAAAAQSGFAVTFVNPAPRSLLQILRYGVQKFKSVDSRAASNSQNNSIPDGVQCVGYFAFLMQVVWRAIFRKGSKFDHALMYVPTWGSLATSLLLARARTYDCVLDWAAAPKEWYPPISAGAVERAIARCSRKGNFTVTTDSSALAERFDALGVTATVLPPAVDDVFLQYEWSGGQRGHYGYFGSVRYSEVDVEYLARLAEDGYPLDIVGPVDQESMAVLERTPAQIHGSRNLNDLVQIVDRWSVILLPYRDTDRSRSLVPAKLWNALSTKKEILFSGIAIPDELQECIGLDGKLGLLSMKANDSVPVPTWRLTFDHIVEERDAR